MTCSRFKALLSVAVFTGYGPIAVSTCVADVAAVAGKATHGFGDGIPRYLEDDWSQKIGPLSQKIAAQPQNAALLVARGEVLLRARLLNGSYDTQSALLDFQKATEIDPQNPAAWVGMARAITSLDVELSAPQGAMAATAKDAVLRQKKRDYLQKSLVLDPKFAPALAEMGWIAREEITGQASSASRSFDIVKPSPEVLLQLQKVKDLAEEAIQISPDLGRAWLLKAETLADSNRAQEALEAYKMSLALDSSPAQEALHSRVNALEAVESSTDVLRYLAVLEKLDGPLLPDFYALRARAKFRLQNWEGALADTNKAIEVAGGGARAARMLVLRGQLKLQQNDAIGAKADFEAASEADPKNLDAMDVLRQIYAAQGNFEASIRMSKQLLAQRDDAHQVRFLLAMLLAFTGDLEGSRVAYEASIGKVSRRDVENQLQDIKKNLKKAPTFAPLMQAENMLLEELGKRG